MCHAKLALRILSDISGQQCNAYDMGHITPGVLNWPMALSEFELLGAVFSFITRSWCNPWHKACTLQPCPPTATPDQS